MIFLITCVCIAITPFSSSKVYGQERFTETIVDTVFVTSQDGTKLFTVIARPDSDGSFPTLVYRTPYGSGWMKNAMHNYAKRGYAFLVQDTRGRYGSEGLFDPFIHAVEDGDATLKWIRSQPWSNGIVGATGHSYVGFTALYLMPGNESPPVSVVAHNPVASPEGGLFRGGAMNHHFDYYWSLLVDGKTQDLEYIFSLDWDYLFDLLPMNTAHRGVDKEVASYRKWLDWANGSFGREELPNINQVSGDSTAVLLVGGWFDLFCPDVIDLYNNLRKNKSGERQKMIIGPFDHSQSPPECDMAFGDWSGLKVSTIMGKWSDRWVLGEKNDVEDMPPVQYFLLGENRWASSESWPPKGVVKQTWYLHSGGTANAVDGSGTLDTNRQGKEPFDSFVYDPKDPVPTKGGILCCLRRMTKAGPMDQLDIEKRSDVLVYTTGLLNQDITVTGPVELVVYASTSAKDTDFTGKLVDVHPDGKALNITDGIVRARFRDGVGTPKFITPGTVERYSINLGSTAITFLKGHRIRLEVSSSNFPRFDRNMNTGGPVGKESVSVKAEQKVYHDDTYRSHLILSVLKR